MGSERKRSQSRMARSRVKGRKECKEWGRLEKIHFDEHELKMSTSSKCIQGSLQCGWE